MKKSILFILVIISLILTFNYSKASLVSGSNGNTVNGTGSNTSSPGFSGGNIGEGGDFCTMDYNPVCGEVEVCLPPNGTGGISNQMCRLGKESKTFGNECQANNVGARILYKGECSKTGTGTKACAQEAKLCSDGKTYVSRTGPNCEFSACPIVIGLSENVKSQLNIVVDKIISVSETKDDKELFIEKIISKLNDMKVSKPKLSRYVDYIISQLK